ncbi:hypothetical protein HMPREF9391_1233 [Streptococcus sanguinis SK408]|uniref:Uncharacterized protein n=1 Tax=Streptococcus sanguinis SK408 TaxID=888818 RepID=F2CE56_STRSA|nr:hypothetical protein HMPREF9394_1851 [Streptococcus sanguinis SK1057]EGF18844.1 hypothetical protein HMPREF9391_1233 [Streptococcus sanguinis SK408]
MDSLSTTLYFIINQPVFRGLFIKNIFLKKVRRFKAEKTS